ncbi:serine hydrolase [Cognatiluteimonas lumbrici]|uniref:serine hydrolase n=1 Tax=Cognatiluteimonas lumbrici TaxID=2559601 RepID=UPI00112E5216|nr:serine hydrolase [Luteimonas lumbrici]
MHFKPASFATAVALALAIGLAHAAPPQSVVLPESVRPLPPPLPAQLGDFDAYVEGVREAFDVPGIAVAIVKDDRVLLENGWGVADRETGAPVDAHTLFAIASNTKAFTAASLQMLAADGKLEMDDRVIEHLPWFRMSDPYITHEMRIRDLLAHRSGLSLGAGDLLYWPTTTYTNREVAERLKDVPITGGFRAQYAYDNILFGVAQLVVEATSGMAFEDFLKQRIFDPLAMQRTRYNADHLGDLDNIATGYSKADFKDIVPAPRMTWSNVGGAGGIYSSVHDMSKWVRTHLAGGEIPASVGGETGKRLFSEQAQREMWTMLTPIPVRKPKFEAFEPITPNYMGYGEGWNLSDYRGEKMVSHTGGWPGMVSRVTMLPGQGIGVVVLTNAESGAAFNAVTNRVLDAMLGLPPTDWTKAYAEARAKQEGDADEDWKKHLAARDAKSKPSLPLSGYAGTYVDPWYGDVVISREGGKLRLRFGRTADLVGTLEHWQHDTFIVRWDQRWLNADAFLSFALDPDGNIREARMEPVSDLTDFSFDFQDLRLTPKPDDAED